ncbi:CBS domain-containing protein [Pseudidiomarina planktonica]|uniref:CBS domain-containing protein n=2 Tax=Pseudidiomarina planktonica TaxID=1323738 RepID=A0A1Y6EHU0_9GAMM|nr:CBS domain-containing protein [Pseudidiomarina planktonica]
MRKYRAFFMKPDFAEVENFLADCPPFDQLDTELRQWAIRQMQAAYVNEHNANDIVKEARPALFIVRSGVYDLRAADDRLIDRLEEADLFGYPSMLSGRPITNRVKTIQDGVVYILPQAAFDELRSSCKPFEQYFIKAHGQRLLTEEQDRAGSDWSDKLVSSVVSMKPVSLPSHTPIQEAAKVMAEHKISSVLIIDSIKQDERDKEHLVGILTDRDIRNRVVARGLSYDVAVSAVMTQTPATVYGRQSLVDALTVMTQSNIHHLPVLDDNDNLLGMVTTTDLMRQQRSEPVFLISAIYKARTKEELVAEAKNIPEYMQTFAGRVRDTSVLGRLLASLTDGMTRQLIHMYEREHGVAPAPYAWIAFGSQGREDQTLSSDQDNGLLLSNDLNDAKKEWFKGLGEYVCQGLYECGIPLCPGNIMASNPDCRRSLNGWIERFEKWTQSPTPKALMYCQIFFDCRLIEGNSGLYHKFREQVIKLGKTDVFIANLAILVNQINVPLGLFNSLKADHDLIDIKRYGLAIINDVARLYALQAGLEVPQTTKRLQELRGSRLLNRRDNQSLQEAWQFLAQLRLNHQLEVWGTDEPKNKLNPDQLSTLTRRQLKSAFRIIKEAQQGVGLKFGRQGY